MSASLPSRPPTILLALVAVLALAGCADLPEASSSKKEPVTVEKVPGTDLSRLILDPEAATSIGVTVEPVGAMPPAAPGQPDRLTIPYGALLYAATGETFVYTNPQPLTFLRAPVEVDVVQGGTAVLRSGPPPGTQIVTVGGAELVGIEFGVGK